MFVGLKGRNLALVSFFCFFLVSFRSVVGWTGCGLPGHLSVYRRERGSGEEGNFRTRMISICNFQRPLFINIYLGNSLVYLLGPIGGRGGAWSMAAKCQATNEEVR